MNYISIFLTDVSFIVPCVKIEFYNNKKQYLFVTFVTICFHSEATFSLMAEKLNLKTSKI